MDRTTRISFIQKLPACPKKFLDRLNLALESNDFKVLREGGNKDEYRCAVGKMDRVRCDLFASSTRDPVYNPSEFIEALVDAATLFSYPNSGAKVEDHVLAIAALKSLYSINTTESLSRLYLCLKDTDIDTGVRVSVINYLISMNDETILPKLREIKTYFERCPGSEFDNAAFMNILDRAIETME